MCFKKRKFSEFVSPLSLENGFLDLKSIIAKKGFLTEEVYWDPNVVLKFNEREETTREIDVVTLQQELFPQLAFPDYWLTETTNAQRKLGCMSLPTTLISNGVAPKLDNGAMQKMQASQKVALGKWYDEVMFRSLDCEAFEEIDRFCTSVYQHYQMLDPNERFGSQPDIYSAIRCNEKIIGTLGYKFRDLPVKKTYNVDFPNLTHEIMRFSIHPDVGYRIEEIPVKTLKKREEKEGWQNAKEYKGNYYRLVSVRREIGKILFASMSSYYRRLAKFCKSDDIPDLKISTHAGVIKFCNKCLGWNIFQLEDAELNEDGIDEQSKVAYKSYGFRLYTIKKEVILRERYAKECFK